MNIIIIKTYIKVILLKIFDFSILFGCSLDPKGLCPSISRPIFESYIND